MIAIPNQETHQKSTAKSFPTLIGSKNRRRQMALLMLAADLLGFSLGFLLLVLVNRFVRVFTFQWVDFEYSVIPIVCIFLFMNSKLYPGVGINPAEEIRLVTQFISSGFLIGLILHLVIQPQRSLNFIPIVIVGIISLMMILLVRWFTRILAVQLGLWGEAVVVIGHGARASKLSNYFLLRRRLGFVPVLAVMNSAIEQSKSLSIP